MLDLATLTAAPTEITVSGVAYKIHPLRLSDFGELQAWVDRQFPDALDVVQKKLGSGKFTAAQEQFLLRTAIEQSSKAKRLLGTPEADALVESVEGVKELLYLSIRKGDPAFDREKAETLFSALQAGDVARIFQATNADLVIAAVPKAEGDGAPTTTSP